MHQLLFDTSAVFQCSQWSSERCSYVADEGNQLFPYVRVYGHAHSYGTVSRAVYQLHRGFATQLVSTCNLHKIALYGVSVRHCSPPGPQHALCLHICAVLKRACYVDCTCAQVSVCTHSSMICLLHDIWTLCLPRANTLSKSLDLSEPQLHWGDDVTHHKGLL